MMSGTYGLGDAVCPSLDQLMGVVDINDPCQAANASGNPISGSTDTTTNVLTQATGTAPVLGVSSTAWMVMGGVLLGLVFIGGGRRR